MSKNTAKLSKVFKALSNKNRLDIYLEIIEHERAQMKACPISEFISKFKIGAPTVSHHIKELVNAELIESQREGKFLSCSVNQETFKTIQGFFSTEKSLHK